MIQRLSSKWFLQITTEATKSWIIFLKPNCLCHPSFHIKTLKCTFKHHLEEQL